MTQRSLAPSLGGASAAADVAALNASYFDPDAYLKRVLKETRLADLAALQRDMLGEVGGLDSDMQVGRQAGWGRRGCTSFAPREQQPCAACVLKQTTRKQACATEHASNPALCIPLDPFLLRPQMLVYENYNKFIAATDTIKLMSASMEGMDDRMASLRTLIGACCACSCCCCCCACCCCCCSCSCSCLSLASPLLVGKPTPASPAHDEQRCCPHVAATASPTGLPLRLCCRRWGGGHQ